MTTYEGTGDATRDTARRLRNDLQIVHGHLSIAEHMHMHRHLGEAWATSWFNQGAASGVNHDFVFRNPPGSGIVLEIALAGFNSRGSGRVEFYSGFPWDGTGTDANFKNLDSRYAGKTLHADVEHGTDLIDTTNANRDPKTVLLDKQSANAADQASIDNTLGEDNTFGARVYLSNQGDTVSEFTFAEYDPTRDPEA